MPASPLDFIFSNELLFKTALALLRNSSLGNLTNMHEKLQSNINKLTSEIKNLNLNKSKIIRTRQKLDLLNKNVLVDINNTLINVNGSQIAAYRAVLNDLDNSVTDVSLLNTVGLKVNSVIQDVLADNYTNVMKRNSVEYVSLKLDRVLNLYDLKINNLTRKVEDLKDLRTRIQSALSIKDAFSAKGLILNKVIFLDNKSIRNILMSV